MHHQPHRRPILRQLIVQEDSCDNLQCPTRQDGGVAFDPHFDNTNVICTSCGMVQLVFGHWHDDANDKTFKESKDDNDRLYKAGDEKKKHFGTASGASLASKEKLLDHTTAQSLYRAEQENLRVARTIATRKVEEKLEAIHPRKVADPANLTAIRKELARVKQERQSLTPLPAAAVASTDEDEDARPTKRAVPEDATVPEAVLAEQLRYQQYLLGQQMTQHLKREREAKQVYQATFQRELDQERVEFHTATGEVRVMTARELQRACAESRSKAFGESIKSRVDELFVSIYRSVKGDATAEYFMNEYDHAWFDRTLQYVVDHHTYRSVHGRRIRDQSIPIMHAMILASWVTSMPLSWGVVLPYFKETLYESAGRAVASKIAKFERLGEMVHELEDKLAQVSDDAEREELTSQLAKAQQRFSSTETPVVRVQCRTVGHRGSLEVDTKQFADELGVPINHVELIARFATFYLVRLGQLRYEQEVQALVQRCQKMYTTPPSSVSLEEKHTTATIREFAPNIIAATCVRMVLSEKSLEVGNRTELSDHMVVKTYKPRHKRKRASRPLPTVNGQSTATIKAKQYAILAGVPEREITACMRIIR